MTVPDWANDSEGYVRQNYADSIRTISGAFNTTMQQAHDAYVLLAWLGDDTISYGDDIDLEDVEEIQLRYVPPTAPKGSLQLPHGVQNVMWLLRHILNENSRPQLSAVFDMRWTDGCNLYDEDPDEENYDSNSRVLLYLVASTREPLAIMYDTAKEEAWLGILQEWENDWQPQASDLIECIYKELDKMRLDLIDDRELHNGEWLVAVYDETFDPEGASDIPEVEEDLRRAAEAGDVYGILHFGSHAELKDSLWGMAGYDGASNAIDAYAEQMGWKVNERTNRWDPGLEPKPAPSPSTVLRARGLPPPKVPPPRGPVTSALSPYETKLVDWMLRQRWYDKREDAVAHIIRMRAAGVLKGLSGRGLSGIVETMQRYRRVG